MATQKLNLTRDQLASFLKNFEQIKQFERLFAIVDTVAPSSDTPGIEIQAGNADAAANQALAQIIAEIQPLGCIMAGDSGRSWRDREEELTPKQKRQIEHRAERRKVKRHLGCVDDDDD